MDDLRKNTDPEDSTAENMATESKAGKKHLISSPWIRIPLKTLMWILLVILILPFLLYIPPVQTFVKNVACDVVYKSTGMKVSIDRFRLRFPLDLELDGVSVVEASGDTMVYAGSAVADVKLRPLLELDVQLNRLTLNDGYYRMLSPDSSMILKVRAGVLEVDDKSFANIRTSEINLNKAYPKNGDLSLYMNVWKQKPAPPDSAASTPFLILAHDLTLENFKFGMSMLPTIDTLDLDVKKMHLLDGVVDLRSNSVKWSRASVSRGSARYITPTAEWIAAHPAPPSQPSSGPPMRISGDSISLDGFAAIYATKGAKPVAGFDPAYIKVDDVAIGMRGFYNEASTVRLPITRLEARERSGLQITAGKGTIGVDSIGLTMENVALRTLYSSISANADVPFALMQLNPDASTSVKASAKIGLPDIDAFMPSLKSYTSKIPARNPISLDLDASGSLRKMEIPRLDVALREVIALKARGYAENPMEYKKLRAFLDFDGTLSDPSLIDKFTGASNLHVPAFTIKGTATADRDTYGADFRLLSDAGDVAADGRVSLNSERYDVDASLNNVAVGRFMPGLGIGSVSATVKADGAGFNPVSGHAVTNALINVSSIEYNKKLYRDIKADIALRPDGNFEIYALSENPGLDFDIDGTGSIHPDDYTFDLKANLRDLDLMQLGLSETMNKGSGIIDLAGTASPEKWIYDATLRLTDFNWNLPEQYIHLPGGLEAKVVTTEFTTEIDVDSHLTYLDFQSRSGLKNLIESFTKVSDMAIKQIDRRDIAVDSLSRLLPPFDLTMTASGKGLLNQFLSPYGMSLDTVHAEVVHDSLLRADIGATRFLSKSVNIDTLTLSVNERRNLLDYRIHMGNRPGTFDDFAQVDLNGYVGQNRLAASLRQKDIKGETGYRLGLTAAMADSTLSVHFTPLKSTIAYMPWTLNGDNFIDLNIYNKHIEADLRAQSAESSILLRTETNNAGAEELHAKIDNLRLEDFLKMSVFAPPMTGSLNTDLHVVYGDKRFSGSGTVDLNDFTYNRTRLGNFNLDVDAGYSLSGNTDVTAAMKINGQRAIEAFASLKPDSIGAMSPDSLGVRLTRFPLSIANPFLDNMAILDGRLNGTMRLDGSFSKPHLNGFIAFDSVSTKIPMAGSTLNFPDDSVKVDDNMVKFKNFNIYGVNSNPLSINGTVDASSFSSIGFDLNLSASNFQPVGNDSRARSDLYGKLFLNLDATLKGRSDRMDIRGNVNVLGTTDVTYIVSTATTQLNQISENDVVKFVNFNDTVQTLAADSIVPSMAMRINAGLTISPGTQITVLLPSATGGSNATDRVELQPTANLTYFQNFMGDMRLNGTLTLGNGFARYSIPVVGQKMFEFNPQSNVVWTGDLMNPKLNITATDEMKANVTSGSNSRLVNFLVTLKASGSLSSPQVAFDLSTNDDLSIQNELQGMSADQRQTQAMNLLLYGQYMSGNTKANSNLSGNMLYSFLESQLNSWAAKTIRGVDLTFGIDQYDKLTNGSSSTETSYSYQVSKSLFNNRFKIQVGGNYSTDASADENLENNLISDISLEYILRQTQNVNMSVRLFRHTGYESILEGEVTETGAGFLLKRKLDNLSRLFRFIRRRKKKEPTPADSTVALKKDTLIDENVSKTDLKNDEKSEK